MEQFSGLEKLLSYIMRTINTFEFRFDVSTTLYMSSDVLPAQCNFI